jgi:NADH-quinone oxidoreductase subunit C
MADDTPSGFDAVEDGPGVSDPAPAEPGAAGQLTTEHPSVSALRARFGDAIGRQEIPARDQVVVFVDSGRVREILRWLKEEPEQGYAFLLDLTAVDYGGGRPLQVVYQLWSLVHRRSLRVKTEVPVSDPRLDSVQPLWATANWLEREVYDLFGVAFEGHPDLRRILMPENYAEGHPLRKDFPLRGRFSRAEQTRRALSQEVADFYIPEEMEMGREPQLVPGSDSPTNESDESA